MSKIDDLINRSSLGEPGAKTLREKAPPDMVERIMKRIDELERQCPSRASMVIDGSLRCILPTGHVGAHMSNDAGSISWGTEEQLNDLAVQQREKS